MTIANPANICGIFFCETRSHLFEDIPINLQRGVQEEGGQEDVEEKFVGLNAEPQRCTIANLSQVEGVHKAHECTPCIENKMLKQCHNAWA